MDGIFGKFGLYDFIGIWGPGAIMLTYYYFTLYDKIKDCIDGLNITFPALEQLYRLILLYTAAAYALGVILHEVGKIVTDALTFCFERVKCIKKLKELIQIKLKAYFGKIEKRFLEESSKKAEISKKKTEVRNVEFEEARSYLRFKGGIDTRRMDTYHSVYALSRSLCVGLFAHLILAVCFSESSELLKKLVMIDSILFILFVIRACRYRQYWIKYTFVQYVLVTQENAGNDEQKVHVNRI